MNLRARFVASLCAAAACAAPGCANLTIRENYREKSMALTATTPGVAVLKPRVSPDAHESAWLAPAYPLIWASQLISLHMPVRSPGAQECADELRSAVGAQLASVGLHAIDADAVDENVAARGNLREAGADYLLHSEIRTWSRQYFLIHSQVTVEVSFQLVRLSDGAVVWDGSVKTIRQAGLLQLGNIVSGIFSAPIAGLPLGQVSAVTGPAAKLRGSAYEELVRDTARAVALHLTPDRTDGELEACPCALCEKEHESKPSVVSASIVGYRTGEFHAGDALEVIATAPVGLRASFNLGTFRMGIPMVEQGTVLMAPESDPTSFVRSTSVFRGSYVVQPEDRPDSPLVVSVQLVGGGRPLKPLRLSATPVVIGEK